MDFSRQYEGNPGRGLPGLSGNKIRLKSGREFFIKNIEVI